MKKRINFTKLINKNKIDIKIIIIRNIYKYPKTYNIINSVISIFNSL